jgi:hypothetical protein
MKNPWVVFAFLLFCVSSVKAQDEPVSLTKDQLAWGESQLRQMLKDRPAMASYVKEGDDLWTWTVQQYAGENGHGEVRWDSGDPVPLWDAMSAGPDVENHKPGAVKVTRNFTQENFHKGEPKSGPMLWGSLIWELFMVKNSRWGLEIDARAEAGKLSREAFIVECSTGEHESGQEAHRFFQEVWIPHCKKMKLPYADEQLTARLGGDLIKGSHDVGSIDELFQPGNFHYKFWGDWYDKNYLSKYLEKIKSEKENKKAAGSIPDPP